MTRGAAHRVGPPLSPEDAALVEHLVDGEPGEGVRLVPISDHFWENTRLNMAYTRPTPRPEPEPLPDPPSPFPDELCFDCGCRGTLDHGGRYLTCRACGHLPRRDGEVDLVRVLGLRHCQVQVDVPARELSAEQVAKDALARRDQDPPGYTVYEDAVSDRALAELGALTFRRLLRSRGVDLHDPAEVARVEPNPRPFAHLPPWDELRVAAYRRWPDERFWRSPTRFAEARELALRGGDR